MRNVLSKPVASGRAIALSLFNSARQQLTSANLIKFGLLAAFAVTCCVVGPECMAQEDPPMYDFETDWSTLQPDFDAAVMGKNLMNLVGKWVLPAAFAVIMIAILFNGLSQGKSLGRKKV